MICSSVNLPRFIVRPFRLGRTLASPGGVSGGHVNGTVPPRRQPNQTRRPREYLTPNEVELLRKAARERGRYGHRDATMISVAYRHGLRAAELCAGISLIFRKGCCMSAG